MLCNRFWHVQICTSSKQNKIMYNHVDCRDFHAFWGVFWWCTKKMNILKKYFSREVIIGIIAGDILLLLSILTRNIPLNTLHIRRGNLQYYRKSKKKSWFECLLLLVFIYIQRIDLLKIWPLQSFSEIENILYKIDI